MSYRKEVVLLLQEDVEPLEEGRGREPHNVVIVAVNLTHKYAAETLQAHRESDRDSKEREAYLDGESAGAICALTVLHVRL